MKIMSYSLFGRNTGYYNLLPILIRSHQTLFPGFELRIHHDGNIDTMYYGQAMRRFEELKMVNLVKVDRPVLRTQSMLWRMLPIWESATSYTFCRDLDSIQTPKDRKTIDDFVRTNDVLHGINDNGAHSIPLMGGMVGFKSPDFIRITGFQNFDDMISSAHFNEGKWNMHGSDQEFLNARIWPKLRRNSCIHRLHGGGAYGGESNFFNRVPHIEISGIKPEIAQIDSFTNYLGACQIEITPEKLREFYNNYGNNIPQILAVEKEVNFP